MIHAVTQAHQFERFLGSHRCLGNFGHRGNVFPRGQAGNQVVELEHEADVMAAVTGQFPVIGGTQLHVAITHLARGRHVESAENIEQRRLAGAGGAQHHHQLAGIEIQIDAAQGMHLDFTLIVDLGESASLENNLMLQHAFYRAGRVSQRSQHTAWYTAAPAGDVDQ